MDTILVVNAGSSSVKFQVFEIGGTTDLVRRIKGQMDGIGVAPRLRATGSEGFDGGDRKYGAAEVADVPAALHHASAWLKEQHDIEPVAVGHRVVHGCPEYSGPVLVDDKVL